MTIFYVDLECDDLKGTTLIQLSAISENNEIFNGFCHIPLDRGIPDSITKLTGFYCYQTELFHNGTSCDTHPRRTILKKFSKWLDAKTDGPPILIAHNGFGYDWRVLFKHYKECDLHLNPFIQFCDSLPPLKKFFKLHPEKRPEGDQSYTLSALAENYKIESIHAHNALSDAITLKRVCDYVIFDHKLEADFFIKNHKTFRDYLTDPRLTYRDFQ